MAIQVANLIPPEPASTVWPLAAVDHVAMAVVVAVAVTVAAMVVAAVTAVEVVAVDVRSVADRTTLTRKKGRASGLFCGRI